MTYNHTVDIHLDFKAEFVSITRLHQMLGDKNPVIGKYAEQILDAQAKMKQLSFRVNHIAEELDYLRQAHRTWQACIDAIQEMEADKNA